MLRFQREKFGSILDNFNWFLHQFPAKKKKLSKKYLGQKIKKHICSMSLSCWNKFTTMRVI